MKLFVITTIFLTLLTHLPLASADLHIRARFIIGDEGIDGALVKCFESNWWFSFSVGPREGVYTDMDGNVSINKNHNFWLWLWFWLDKPDYYCEIIPNGQCFGPSTTPIKWNHDPNIDLDFGDIELTFDSDYCGDFGIDSNGCGPSILPSWLRDAASDISGFRDSCDVHDSCYKQCDRTRSDCDEQFLFDMEARCAFNWKCLIAANLFYQAVANFGESFCVSSKEQSNCASADLCTQ